MSESDFEERARLAIFEHLTQLTRRLGETLPSAELRQGIVFEGQNVKLMGPQGIFTPARWSIPISIATAPSNPYGDDWGYGGLLYRYRGADPNHRDNRGLRKAMEAQTPIIYFHALAKGEYLPIWPVYIANADDATLTFTVVDAFGTSSVSVVAEAPPKAYEQRLVRARLHQAVFRRQVISAYRERCAICRLKHVSLLDAAHILRDAHPKGKPEVPNGLSLCKLHHAAFDRNIVGIRPDKVIEVRGDVLAERDGPMLEHGLQGFQGAKLILPPRKEHEPKAEYLEERYEEFRNSA